MGKLLANPGAEFSKGATTALAMHSKISKNRPFATSDSDSVTDSVIVVATYTDMPDLPRQPSIDVCRAPVGLPPLDIEHSVMKVTKLKDEKGNYYYPFHFPLMDKKTLDREEKRLFATLKFKLAVKISQYGRSNLHFPSIDYFTFCQKLHNNFL